MVKSCVFFSVRTGYLNVIYTSLGFRVLIQEDRGLYCGTVCNLCCQREVKNNQSAFWQPQDVARVFLGAFLTW